MAAMEKSMQSLKHEEATKMCPDCGSDQIAHENGEKFCQRCGLVLD